MIEPEIKGAFAALLVLMYFASLSSSHAVLPSARRYAPQHATYTTLLMSTGLTFGTISSLYGLQARLIDATQFSLLITTVILSAVIPTFIAQRWFDPRHRERALAGPGKVPAAVGGHR